MDLIITIIGTITAVITVCLTNYFAKKNQLKFEERKLKEKCYFEYIKCLSNNINYGDKESVFRENEAFNELILIANTQVLKKLYELQDMRIRQAKYSDVKNYNKEYDIKIKELITEIRKDLYGKKDKNLPSIYLLGGYIEGKG